MGWDSNPRGAFAPASLAARYFRPLSHPSYIRTLSNLVSESEQVGGILIYIHELRHCVAAARLAGHFRSPVCHGRILVEEIRACSELAPPRRCLVVLSLRHPCMVSRAHAEESALDDRRALVGYQRAYDRLNRRLSLWGEARHGRRCRHHRCVHCRLSHLSCIGLSERGRAG